MSKRTINPAFLAKTQDGLITTKTSIIDKSDDGNSTSNASKLSDKFYLSARQTGILKIINRNLAEIPKEIEKFNENNYGYEAWWELLPLTLLDLSFNSIRVISIPFITNLHSLTSINLQQNKLSSIPLELFEISNPNLKYLNFSCNMLSSLPENIGILSSLVELNVNNNKIALLPTSFEALFNLQVLSFENNILESLPKNFGLLKRLLKVNLNSNKLSTLPDSFSLLFELSSLELSSNCLTLLPSLLKLSSLSFADFRKNNISMLPLLPPLLDQLLCANNNISSLSQSSIANCLKLTVLDISDNKLTELPKDIANLKLKVLDVRNNDLNDLPSELGYCESLRTIMLDGNSMKKIRRAITEQGGEALKNFLKNRMPQKEADAKLFSELSIDSPIDSLIKNAGYSFEQSGGLVNLAGFQTPLNELPDLFYSNFWKIIDLSNNRLEFLSFKFSAFQSSLSKLLLSRNNFIEIPSVISELESLEEINFNFNKIKSTSFGQFPIRLKKLNMSHNPLNNFPMPILELPLVEDIDLSFCGLSGEVPSLNSMGFSLKSINFSDNKFNALACPDLRYLPNLTYFNIENNDFKNIPLEFGICNHLKALLIQGNPTRSVSYAIIQKGSISVINSIKSKIPLDSHLFQPLRLNIMAPILPDKKVFEANSTITPPIYSIYNRVPIGRVCSNKNIEPNPINDLVASSAKPQLNSFSFSTNSNDTQLGKLPISELLAPVEKKSNTDLLSLQDIDKKISEIERKIEMGVPASKQFTYKREITLLRAQRIKLIN